MTGREARRYSSLFLGWNGFTTAHYLANFRNIAIYLLFWAPAPTDLSPQRSWLRAIFSPMKTCCWPLECRACPGAAHGFLEAGAVAFISRKPLADAVQWLETN
jgi:hypothetical protein